MASVKIPVRDERGLITRVIEADATDPLAQRIAELERENSELRTQLAEASQQSVQEVSRVREEQRAQVAMLIECRDHVYEDLQQENAELHETVATMLGISTRAVENANGMAANAIMIAESAMGTDHDPYADPPRGWKRRKKRRPTEAQLYAHAYREVNRGAPA